MTQAGPAIPVVAVTDRAADAGPALRVAVVSDGRPVEGGPARPVIVVNDGRPTQGNEPIPVVAATGFQAGWVQAGPAIPVVVVSGSLGGGVLNNRVAAIGDSITVANGTLNNYRLMNTSGNVGAYLTWAGILPKTGATAGDGRLQPDTIAATGGLNISQIKTNHLPTILALSPRPGFCVVLGGTNDLGSLTNQAAYDARLADLASMYDQLIAVGILPVACAVPPATAQPARALSLSQQIQPLATARNIPFADFQTVLGDGTGNWVPAYNSGDGTHPSVAGGKVMGQELRDKLEGRLLAAGPPMITTADPKNTGMWWNGCMVDDTDADGDPDGGPTTGAELVNGWGVSSGGADVTQSLVAEAGVVSGKWYRMNKTANTATTSIVSATNPAVADGHNIAVGFMMKVPSKQAAANPKIEMFKATNSAVLLFSLVLNGTADPIAPFAWYTGTPAVVPAGMANVRINLQTSAGTADLHFGQFVMRDLG